MVRDLRISSDVAACFVAGLGMMFVAQTFPGFEKNLVLNLQGLHFNSAMVMSEYRSAKAKLYLFYLLGEAAAKDVNHENVCTQCIQTVFIYFYNVYT